MMTWSKININPFNNSFLLPKVLHESYMDSPFSLQLKAKFLYYLNISIATITALVILSDAFIQNIGHLNASYYYILIGQAMLLVLMGISLWILLKGRYSLAANLLLSSTFIAIWLIVLIDKSDPISRIDTLFYLFGLFTMLPLVLSKRLYLIFVYLGFNIICFITFAFYFSSNVFKNIPLRLEFITDSSLALIFAAIVVFNLFRIDKMSREKIEREYAEKIAAEKQYLKSEKRYSELSEMLPQTIFEADVTGKILYINKMGYKQFGYSPDDVKKGVNLMSTIAPEEHERLLGNIKKVLSNEMQTGNEYTAVRKDGSRFPVRIFSTAHAELNEKVQIRGIIIDVSVQKKNEKELEQYRNQLESIVKVRTEELESANENLVSTNSELLTQREKLQTTLDELKQAQIKLIEVEKMASLGILASGVAHEINNPLNFIQGGIFGINEYISETLPTHTENMQQMTESIQLGIDRVVKIVQSLNHFSRQTESFTDTCDIHAIIENCLTMLQNQIKHKVEVIKNFGEESIFLTGNEGKLHQAFLNILMNAQQAIIDKGKIIITTSKEKDYIVVSIADTGEGIKPEDMNQIFNPFFTTKDPGSGTGLGLSITYKIINEHRGKLEYASVPKQGTTAIITFPVS